MMDDWVERKKRMGDEKKMEGEEEEEEREKEIQVEIEIEREGGAEEKESYRCLYLPHAV